MRYIYSDFDITIITALIKRKNLVHKKQFKALKSMANTAQSGGIDR